MGRVWTVELLLYHRLCWLRGGYGVYVSMHYLPGAIFFGSKDHRNRRANGAISSLPLTLAFARSISIM